MIRIIIVIQMPVSLFMQNNNLSMNITPTPNKGSAAPAVENGKNVDEEIIADEMIIGDDTTKVQNLLIFSNFLFLLKLFKGL